MAITIIQKHIQEALVALYLRLNGFFTSGHIVHASLENLAIRERAEVDVFAVRLPYNREPERGVVTSEYLDVKDGILDIIIGEVKSGGEPIQFNPSIQDASNMYRTLRWAGFTNNDELLCNIAKSLTNQIRPLTLNRPDNKREFLIQPSGDILYQTRLRPIIFHLGYRRPNRNQAWFVGYEEIMNYPWQCLRPELQPDSCQRVYDYGLWGPVIESIVEYFKDGNRIEPGTPNEMLQELIG